MASEGSVDLGTICQACDAFFICSAEETQQPTAVVVVANADARGAGSDNVEAVLTWA